MVMHLSCYPWERIGDQRRIFDALDLFAPVAARSPEVAVHVQLSRLLASQVACDQIRFGRVDEAAAVVLEGVQAWLERLGARRISATRRTQELIMRWMGQPNLDRSRDEYDHGLLLAHILSLPVQPQLKDKSLVRGNLLFGSLVGSLWDRQQRPDVEQAAVALAEELVRGQVPAVRSNVVELIPAAIGSSPQLDRPGKIPVACRFAYSLFLQDARESAEKRCPDA